VSTGEIMTAVALGPAASREAIEAACAGEPGITLAGFVPAALHGASALVEHEHQALVVACAGESEEILAFISGAVADRPERPVVVVYEGSANGFVSRAFAAGAADLIGGELSPGADGADRLGRDIAFALEKAIARGPANRVPAAGARARTRAETIAVLGPKGGTGKTLTVCNLAAALAAAGQSVIVVDLDLQFGDVALALGLPPDRTLYDLVRSGGSLDAEKIEDFLAEHSSGVRALLAPRRPDHAGSVTVDFVRGLLDTLREMTDYVVVDTPPGFTPEVIAAIDRSSEVCIVAMLDALSLKNTKLGLETLDLMGYDHGRIKVVLNRADSRVGVTTDDVTSLLGRAPDVRVPSHRDITRSVNEGLPIVMSGGNAEARRAFESLAAGYIDAHAEHTNPAAPTTSERRKRGISLRRRGS
jgi:pilus assembly protein CpaE